MAAATPRQVPVQVPPPPPAKQQAPQPLPALTRVVLCVEATAAMAPTWASDRANYIEPLLRAADGGRLGHCHMACVFFSARSPFSLAMVERSHWSDSTSDMRAWLDSLPLAGGGGCGATAFAEALADAICLLRQAEAHLVAPDGSNGSSGGGGNADSGAVANGGGVASGSVSRQVVVVARSDPHRLAIPWPVPEDISPKAPLPGRVSYTDLVAALLRRGIGLSIVTGAVQPHKWLVLAALKVAEGPAAEDASAAPTAPGSRHPELFKAMAAGAGQDSTALLSTTWPHALKLLQGLASERRAALKAAAAIAGGSAGGSKVSTPGQSAVTPGGVSTPGASMLQYSPATAATGAAGEPPALQTAARVPSGGMPPIAAASPAGNAASNAPSPAYWAPSPAQNGTPPPAAQAQPQQLPPQQQAAPMQTQQPVQQPAQAPYAAQPPQPGGGYHGATQQPPQAQQPQPQQMYLQAGSPAGSIASAASGGSYAAPISNQQQQGRPVLTPQQQAHLAQLRALPPEQQAAEIQRMKAKRQQQLAAVAGRSSAPGPAGSRYVSEALMPGIPSAAGRPPPPQPYQQHPQQQQLPQQQYAPAPQQYLPAQQQPVAPQLPPQPAAQPQQGRAQVVWEGELVLSPKAAKGPAEIGLARVRVVAQQTVWSPGEVVDWPAVLSVDKITKRAALIQNLPLAKAPRCSLALTRAFTPTLERGHATLLELAQREIGCIVQLRGRALVLLLGLQQPPPPQAPQQPPLPLLISGYVVQHDQMPP